MKQDRNIVFGKHSVMRALAEPKKVDKVFMLQQSKGPLEMDVRDKCTKHNIPLIKTHESQLNKLCKSKNHQGIVAVIAPIHFQEIEDILPHLFENGDLPFILILDRVSDVKNFGAIVRSAEVLGCHAIMIPKKGTAALTNEAVKSSAGAIFDMPICRVKNLLEGIAYLKESGLKIYASDMNHDEKIADQDWKQPIGVIMGAEDKGIHREALALADNIISIPQVGKTDSLNVSVASGIIMYEVMKARMANLKMD